MNESKRRWQYFKASILVEEVLPIYCMHTVKILKEGGEGIPPADITVGEMLDKIEELEKIQLERKPLFEEISKLEGIVTKWIKVVKKDGTSTKDENERKRLAEFEASLEVIASNIRVFKNSLNDKETTMMELAEQTAEILDDWTEGIIKNARTIVADLDLDGWENILEWSDTWFAKIGDIPGMGTIAGFGKDVNKVLKWAKKGVEWLMGKEEKPAKAIDNMVDLVAQRPDVKFRTAPFLELFNIDDEYVKMLDDELQVKFIEWYKQFLGKNARNIKIKDLDIDSALEKWIPSQREYQGHGITTQVS
tara:strand:+ start:838 stop:1755 length:918 start_codon:yes stop_codon:yes gene_type:complete